VRAANEKERARVAAGQVLFRTLAAIPLAASIQEAFALRLNDEGSKCEKEKSDVLARMRQELDGLKAG
jgi:hypothetical protein